MKLLSLALLTTILLSGCGSNQEEKKPESKIRLSTAETTEISNALAKINPQTTASASDNQRKAAVIEEYTGRVKPGPCLDSLNKLQQAYQQNNVSQINQAFGQSVSSCVTVKTEK